jgi:hypothetical protein
MRALLCAQWQMRLFEASAGVLVADDVAAWRTC